MENGFGVADVRQMPGHEMNYPAAGPPQDSGRMKVDLEDERRFQEQRQRPAEPLGLHLLDIVQYRVGSAGVRNPFLALAKPEEFVWRDEDAQIERLVRVPGFVALNRLDPLGAQTPGQHVGDCPHEEIAERTAKDPYTDALFAEQPYDRLVAGASERAVRRIREAVSLGFDFRIQLRQQAGNEGRISKGAPLLQAECQKVLPGIAAHIRVKR